MIRFVVKWGFIFYLLSFVVNAVYHEMQRGPLKALVSDVNHSATELLGGR